MSYDLIVRPPQGLVISSDAKRQIVEAFRNETNLDGVCEVTIYRDCPYPTDEVALNECFLDGDFSREEFEEFCISRGFLLTTQEERAMASKFFLDFQWGQDLFSPTLPENPNEAKIAYLLVVDFATRHNLVIHDPQAGRNIDLRNSGDFPPMW